jgi:hypothetical protein
MADEPSKPFAPEDVLRDAALRNDIPKIYANGFSVGMSNADIVVVFQRFGPNPVGVVNLSYTLAKTLAQRLGRLVAEFERQIGQDILTTDRIDEAMRKSETAEKPASEPVKKTSDVH